METKHLLQCLDVDKQQFSLSLKIFYEQGSMSFHRQKVKPAIALNLRTKQTPSFNPRRPIIDDAAMKRLELTTKQSKFISDTMQGIRQKEMESRANKRVKTTHVFAVHGAGDVFSNQDDKQNGALAIAVTFLDEMELHSHVAQIVATTGGLVTNCKHCEFVLF